MKSEWSGFAAKTVVGSIIPEDRNDKINAAKRKTEKGFIERFVL